ncbi:hypothetical protein CURE108131_18780 [Cupriavidus respiraculi]|uniref:Uncharacterized protein n=1 Tax=Cupriavidus respiraculi TaxID=195930 RepID=A0ABM8XUK0_9BURK|nr:hypothetical protein LMG21510_05012 [Cupriavidus respiraculi]
MLAESKRKTSSLGGDATVGGSDVGFCSWRLRYLPTVPLLSFGLQTMVLNAQPSFQVGF